MADIASAAAVAVVLVHGGFVDGSGWEDVYKILKKDGYNVSIVQNPTLSLSDDVAVTKRVLAKQKTPVSWTAVDHLPTTPFGKVRKQELIDRLAAG